MQPALDLGSTAGPTADLDDDAFDGLMDDDGLERMAFYQEIAERRAQLECAETLRRARAL